MEVETEISSISKLETHGLGSKAVLPFTPFALLKGFAAMRRKLSVLVISALFLAVADVSTSLTTIILGFKYRGDSAIHRALRVPDGS